MKEDTLSKVSELWDNASIYSEQQQRQWAQDEALLNARHLTPRKPGRSSLFVPKIPGYHRRKMADFVGQFVGDQPVTIKNTLTSHPIGAKIKQKVHNHILATGVEYEALIYNGAYCGLGYNFAPAHLDWYEETVTEKTQTHLVAEDGSTIIQETEQEVVVASYPVISAIPPENIRIDPSVSWDNLDDARYIGFQEPVDAGYAAEMQAQGKWPKIPLEYFNENATSAANRSNPLKAERRSAASPFSNTAVDSDNELVDVRYHYYYKRKGKEFLPVRTVTLADVMVLEDAKPLDINWGGNKHAWPFVVGQVYPKPFEQYADALPTRGKDMQLEVNAIRNQRRDNVALILNPEKYVTPYAGITPDQLAFSFPGKVVTVDNLNAIQWQSVPDATATGHSEESRVEQDMDRLFSEGPMRAGVEGRRKESATAIQQMTSNASAATGLDTLLFMTTFVRPLNEKLGNAIAQKAPEELFHAAANELQVNPQSGIDPVLAATEGDFIYNVYASAAQNDLANALANASNITGLIQTLYGPNANYKPFVDELIELAGHDPDAIIPNPVLDGFMANQAQQDMGGVEPGGSPSIMPRAQFQGGGAMGAGSGKQ